MVPEIDLFAIERGAIVSPAGCGKTELVVRNVVLHSAPPPVLILTHTNAGVQALRSRLQQVGALPQSYVLSTIDGWAVRLVTTFPQRSCHDVRTCSFSNPRSDYPKIRQNATRLLEDGHLSDVLCASYAHVIVDEYQDCSLDQHKLASSVANSVPTCILGDPMQAIFGFAGTRLPDWDTDVCTVFPIMGTLDTPWRWHNAGTRELGSWLLDVREKLSQREPVDVRDAPTSVRWVKLRRGNEQGDGITAAQEKAASEFSSVLVLGDSRSPVGQARVASRTPGAVTIDAVQMKDLIQFAEDLDLEATDALDRLLAFAQSVMTNVGRPKFLQRIHALTGGTAKKAPNAAESKALRLVAQPSYGAASELLLEISQRPKVRKYRPHIFWSCIKALKLCNGAGEQSFLDATRRVREQARFGGRRLPRCAVGSTLLLKGLEAEAVVVLNADELDSKNLYVAITRGSKQVTICSRSPLLNPQPSRG